MDVASGNRKSEIDEQLRARVVISEQYTDIAPMPTTLAETGVSVQLLRDLLLKHIYDASVISLNRLAERMALAGSVVETLSQLLREDALVELSSNNEGDGSLSFRLTERGRYGARAANDRSGYIGPAPVPLEQYNEVVNHFTLKNHSVTEQSLKQLFSEFVIEDTLQDQLGAAFNSRKAIFIYGPAGTGKTYTISKIIKLFNDRCLIPYAIAIKDSLVQVFDPQIHVKKESTATDRSLLFRESYDPRYLPCQRPVVMTGGELTADLLEVRFDAQSNINQAPLQLKANNGVFFIDDIGRQSVPASTIFNRWIVPMEENRDFLSLVNGQHFKVPFDVQLVFSSNINPLELADDAILRRIGFKIHFEAIKSRAYAKIWQQELSKNQLTDDEHILEYVLKELHFKENVDLLPCHPRDLIQMALTQAIYKGEPGVLSKERFYWAWKNYFVNLDVSNDVVIH